MRPSRVSWGKPPSTTWASDVIMDLLFRNVFIIETIFFTNSIAGKFVQQPSMLNFVNGL